MSDPLWREARPNRPYGSEPGARPRGRDPGTLPGAPRTPPAGARTPGRDPGRNDGGTNRAREVGGGRGDARGSDPRGRDPGWGGRDSGPRGAGGNGWTPGPPAGRGGDPGAGPQTRRMPAPRGVRGDGSPRSQGVPEGRPPGSTQPTETRAATTQPTETWAAGTRAATTQPRGTRDRAARGPGGSRDYGGRRSSPRPRASGRLGRWGAQQGGLGVCLIVASAAIGAIVTMVARSAPGFLLGFFVVAGTVAASLAVRPRAGRMIFPVPVLSYLVAALISGVVFERSAGASTTVLAIGAAQWIASGFFAMALATVLAVVITTVRWFLWRRGRPATRHPGRPAPPAGPARTGPTRARTAQAGPVQAGPVQAGPGRDGVARPPRGAWETSAESGYPAGFAGPGIPRESGSGYPAGERGGRPAWGSWGSWGLGRPGLTRHRPSSRAAPRSRTLQLLQRRVTEH